MKHLPAPALLALVLAVAPLVRPLEFRRPLSLSVQAMTWLEPSMCSPASAKERWPSGIARTVPKPVEASRSPQVPPDSTKPQARIRVVLIDGHTGGLLSDEVLMGVSESGVFG